MSTTVNTIVEEVRCVREHAGVWLRDDATFIRITGADAGSWLHSQTSNDVSGLASGAGNANAVLDRQGRLQAHFTVHRWEDEYWLLVEKTQAAHLMAHLDAHLFIEDAQMEDAGESVEQVVIQGPRTLGFLSAVMDREGAVASLTLPQAMYACQPVELLGYEVLAFRVSFTGEDGYVFVVEAGQGRTLLDALVAESGDFTVRPIGGEARDILRIEAGMPRFGVDMDTGHQIPQTTLERECVSYEKGCYLGQEVVARLRAYGSVRYALVGLVFEPMGDVPWPVFDSDLLVDGKKAGQIKSATWSPTLDATIALAYIDRDRRAPGTRLSLTVEGQVETWEARVVILPFYEAASREDRARALYDDALARFERDQDDEDASAIPLLKEAVLLHPTFEDAYEVLGVILHRHHRVDEAIHYMQILAKMNPDCLMAHTNLSVFYVAKGMIDAAEEEKAKAAVLQIQAASNERAAKEMAEQERRRLEEEARERIAMFEEVLEIDPDDPVATFGLGKAYIQLQHYEKAIPYLEHSTEVQKDYSAAYLDLGKCHEFLGRNAEAIAAYTDGIAVASRKGDLMPLREMERRLTALQG